MTTERLLSRDLSARDSFGGRPTTNLENAITDFDKGFKTGHHKESPTAKQTLKQFRLQPWCYTAMYDFDCSAFHSE